jgi:hypothetical protein
VGSPAAIAPRETLEMTGPYCGAKGGNGRAVRDRNPALHADRLHVHNAYRLKLGGESIRKAESLTATKKAAK